MSSQIMKLTRPGHALRRVRELGPGRVASDLFVKRAKMPMGLIGPAMRAVRVARHPALYLRRRAAARAFVRAHGNPLEIPDALGYRFVEPHALPGHEAVLRVCQDLARERAHVLDRFPDRYGINLLASDGLTWTDDALDLRGHDTLLDFALSPPLIAAAAGYLGEMPALTSIQIYCTTDRHSLGGNNFYHFDKDHRQVKFWMAVNDIADESGPFTFMPADKSRIVRKKAGYFGRLADERVYAVVPREHRIEFKGPAGSMLLVDTCRCVHFGSRTKKGPRIMLLVQYQSPFAWFEQVFYYQQVLYNAARYRGHPIAGDVFVQMRDRVPGKRSGAASM